LIGFLNRSILRRILAALLSIYAATYFATAIVVYSGVRASLLESHAGALNQFADLKYDQLANAIGALATDLAAWSELDVMNDLVSGDIDKRVAQTLEALKQSYELPGDIYAFDAKGKLIASSRRAPVYESSGELPRQWQDQNKSLVFVDKDTDPVTGGAVVALVSPVFGNFDHRYRVGTLVMTYPWTAVEKMLSSLENGTILLERRAGSLRVLAANPPELAAQARSAEATDGHPITSADFVLGRSLRKKGLTGDWQVLAMQPIDVALRPLRWVALDLGLLGGFLAVPIVLLGRWLSQRLTAPIADLTRVVRAIAETDKLDSRVPITSADELGSLAQSFNTMTENLERTTQEREQFVRELATLNQSLETKITARTAELQAAMTAQQRLLGDISHEIKSPLARLSMALGLARRSSAFDAGRQFDRAEHEIENISALTSELLTLARLGSVATPLAFEKIDLGALVDQIVSDAIYEQPTRRSDIALSKPDRQIFVSGNADMLRRAVENVVRNALFYTKVGTTVEIAVIEKTSEMATIEVRDQGPGVPAAALPHLFEPFYRVDDARARETGGSGIGLAICQRVVQLHRGSVGARSNAPSGLIVEIDFPRMRESS
jgi:signal transduction histidine kinase